MYDHLTDRKIDGSLGKYVLLILECKKYAGKKRSFVKNPATIRIFSLTSVQGYTF